MGSNVWDDHGVASLVQSRTKSTTLSIILCAPHGGNAVDGDQAETLLERSVAIGSSTDDSATTHCSMNVVADVGTSQLLEEIDHQLTRNCGQLYADRSRAAVGPAEASSNVDVPPGVAAAVVARFHRKYVDANRSLDDGDARAVHPSCARAHDAHRCYHSAIAVAVEHACQLARVRRGRDRNNEPTTIVKDGCRPLLLDIHGQDKFADKVLIGTR